MTSTRPVTRATGSSAIPQLIFGDLWEYDPAPETADPRLKPKYDLFIGGKFVAPNSTEIIVAPPTLGKLDAAAALRWDPGEESRHDAAILEGWLAEACSRRRRRRSPHGANCPVRSAENTSIESRD